jgi:hypothetical protein
LNNLTEEHESRLIFLGILSVIFTEIIFYPNILLAPFVFDDYSAAIDTEMIKSLKWLLKSKANQSAYE